MPCRAKQTLSPVLGSHEALVGAVAVALGTAALTPKAVAMLGGLRRRWTAETPRVVCASTATNDRLLARCPHLSTSAATLRFTWSARFSPS